MIEKPAPHGGEAVAKFMILYKGEATDMSDMSRERAGEVMAKWAAWMGKVGPAMADIGTPLGAGTSVLDDGSEGTPGSLTGYSILEASDMATAQALTDGHPYLSDNDGLYAIDIYEMMPVPEM